MERHQKHNKLNRKKAGFFSNLELACLGLSCENLSNFIHVLAADLGQKHRLAYIDASHSNSKPSLPVDRYTLHQNDTIGIEKPFVPNQYKNQIQYNSYDLILVNGSHYQANNHIIFLNSEKAKSIEKRIDEIDNIVLFIATQEQGEIYDCIQKKFPDYNQIPIIKQEEIGQIAQFLDQYIQLATPSVMGLILTGGQSKRMGQDKSMLEYFGVPHGKYLFDLLEQNNLQSFYSISDLSQKESHKIIDVFRGLGPFGAICSAFMQHPNNAFLVLATDLPFVDNTLIQLLLDQRDPSKIASCLKGRNKKFPEPLITIWEPKSYQILLNYLSLGISCPRKVLIQEDIKIIEVDDIFLTNVNTYKEFKEIQSKLKT